MKKILVVLVWSSIVSCLIVFVPTIVAHPTWSVNGNVNTNCAFCHGDFRSNAYVSNSDGLNWGNLHNLHRFTMLDGDCDTCHSASNYPVFTTSSEGGTGFQAISCMGCHGREEDMGNDSISAGRGAGLRQHHTNNGVMECLACHFDADPALYTTVGENVAPSYYFLPDASHPDKPSSSCSPVGEEDYAGIAEGLDNDGDNDYDGADIDCVVSCLWDCGAPVDGSIGIVDLLALLSQWGGPGSCDLDGGGVGISDLLAILANWGPCP